MGQDSHHFRIKGLTHDYVCRIRFRDFEDAMDYASRNCMTRDALGGKSYYVIVKLDCFGNENSFDRWEI